MNDHMEQELMAGSALHAYTDDILLYHATNAIHNFLALQSDIDEITEWSCANFSNYPTIRTSTSLWFV